MCSFSTVLTVMVLFSFVQTQVQLQNGLFQKKLKQGSWGYAFFKPLGLFIFFTLPLEIPGKTKLNPWTFHTIVLDPLEIPHYFFLVTLVNSTSFLINPWKFHMPFLWYPWKFHIYPLRLRFSEEGVFNDPSLC